MKRAYVFTMAACVGLANAQPVPATAATTINGDWWTPGFNARVRIAPCGDALCGHIGWVWDGTPKDIADKSPLVGRKVSEGMVPESPARWSSGRLYNPEDGRDYKGSLMLAATNRLLVDDCVRFICKSQVWRRADSERCPPVAPL